MEPLSVFLLILVIIMAILLLGGYGVYRIVIERRREKRHPKPGKAKTALRRRYTENYLQQMQWLDSWGYERVEIQSRDGQKLVGMLFLAQNPTKKTVLAVHGYRVHGFREYLYMAPMYLEELGMNLLLVDNYAHGDSGGRRIGFGWNDRLDCILWADWLVDRFGPESELLLQGVSMGASTVLMAAAEPLLPAQVRWVVADCAFTSAGEMVRRVMTHKFFMPAFPFYHLSSMYCKLLAGYYYGEADTEKMVKRIKIPVLFIHGQEDPFIPPQMSGRLYDAGPAPKEYLPVPGAAHAESYLAAPGEYLAAVRRLLEKTPEPI
ncbi:alpha/beta hydrolase [Ruminococcaceae bacterium OttesenSCG-928-I18]|nr:alpha/beta hydrolase [Ruminococcaceae bacterium OttesenSCG-928-I18]